MSHLRSEPAAAGASTYTTKDSWLLSSPSQDTKTPVKQPSPVPSQISQEGWEDYDATRLSEED